MTHLIIHSGPGSLDPETFFKSAISPRVPYKFTSLLQEDGFRASSTLWTEDYLCSKAGDSIVQVERREREEDSFGKGKSSEVSSESFMTFRDFLTQRNPLLYLTTQELEVDAEDRPSIMSPPIDALVSDFPWRPKLMHKLIPQNINLWMGFSSAPSSSGLHHDYHDNLYILLKGSKTFTLFSPQEHENMYTYGELLCIHPNGRINYVGQSTNADGSHQAAVSAARAAEALQSIASKLDRTEDEADEGVEDEIEMAMEAALNAEMDGDDVNWSDNDEKLEEEDSEEEEEEVSAIDGRIMSAIECSLRSQKRPVATSSSSELSRGVRDDIKMRRTSLGRSDSTPHPPNFSRVNTVLSLKELKQEFPKYVDAYSRRVEVTLVAGEMLYLPAGWFHEVRSLGLEDGACHMALNYWFHPPDSSDFQRPYTTDFWHQDWMKRGLPSS